MARKTRINCHVIERRANRDAPWIAACKTYNPAVAAAIQRTAYQQRRSHLVAVRCAAFWDGDLESVPNHPSDW